MKTQRNQRGGRVAKPSGPARGGRVPAQQQVRHVQQVQQQVGAQMVAHDAHGLADHQHNPNVFDDDRLNAEQYAAVAAQAVMDANMTPDAHVDADADADLDDQDHSGAAGLSSHVDLGAAANILANGGQPDDNQVQGHPDLGQGLAHVHHQQVQNQMGMSHMGQEQPPMDPSIKTTEQFALESGYQGITPDSTLAKRLAREPGQRHAAQRRPEQALNLGRRSNVEALFAHIAGAEARVPCKNCHKGHGPWNSCIVVDGQMCGSCANCWFNASGARCSFHETRNPPPTQTHQPMLQANNAGLVPEPGFRFSTPHGMPVMPPAPGPSGMAGVAYPASFTQNPALQNTIASAINQTRSLDKMSRQLLHIDITAKQLALQIVEYEEMMAHAGHDSPSLMSGQQGMGDDPGQ
ncbi:hypothetical protein QBC39DRAFT_266114 [Podospora conica]|nr:hypothetical protein QBC39DRAFT_266114 [Schizothecium conicum]